MVVDPVLGIGRARLAILYTRPVGLVLTYQRGCTLGSGEFEASELFGLQDETAVFGYVQLGLRLAGVPRPLVPEPGRRQNV